jgi:hypothetical protein
MRARNTRIIIPVVFSIAGFGCEGGSTGDNDLKESKRQVSSWEEVRFRKEVSNVVTCEFYAIGAKYQEDAEKLSDMSDLLLALRGCSLEEAAATRCVNAMRSLPEDVDKDIGRSVAKEMCAGIETKEGLDRAFELYKGCFEKYGISYDKKYIQPLYQVKRSDFKQKMKYQNKSVKELASEEYASSCAYL